MKHNKVKITCNNLIDYKTGKFIEFYVDEKDLPRLNAIGEKAEEAGARFRRAVDMMNNKEQ